MKSVWNHFLATLAWPVVRSKLLAAEWPIGLASTLQMAHQLLGETPLAFPVTTASAPSNQRGSCHAAVQNLLSEQRPGG